jgi:hypothetical protein
MTTLLYAPIKEDVHIRQPLGFADGTLKLYHFERCLYSFKPCPREFSTLLRDCLVDYGWE